MHVEIESRESLMARAREPFPKGTAVISITDSDAEDVELAHLPEHILRLKFDDVSDEIYEDILGRKPTVREMHKISQRFHVLSNAQTRQLTDFILRLDRAGSLICQCEYGQSRSAAVAAAVMEHCHRKGIQIFADSRYYPNKYVFRKLYHGLQMRDGQICPEFQTFDML